MFKEHVPDCKTCQGVKLTIKKVSSNLVNVEVFVPQKVITRLEKYAVKLYKNYGKSRGFSSGSMPETYIKEHFKSQIAQDVRKFILKYIVLDSIQEKAREKNSELFKFPRLVKIHSPNAGGLIYTFTASQVGQINIVDWKKLSFLPPRRKLYKDLDRQAQIFIENQVNDKNSDRSNWRVENGDWVCFKSKFLTDQSVANPLKEHENRFWMKISTKYMIDPFQKLFFEKHIDEKFSIDRLPMHGVPTDTFSRKGHFDIVVDSIWKGGYFCLNLFKSAFGISTDREVHDKLVEVFSFRNDISQRRSIVEEAFRSLLSRFRLEMPRHLVLRRKENILAGIRDLPDYHVYKASKDFSVQLERLSERQLREEAIIDFISSKEGIELENDDMKRYLNLFSNDRLAEFIYFKPQVEGFGQSVMPIRENLFAGEVLREKVLNYVINTIAKK